MAIIATPMVPSAGKSGQIPKFLDCFPLKKIKLSLDEKYPRVEDKMTQRPFHDYITKIPEVFLFLECNSTIYQLINKPPYHYLVKILEQGPFTMNEIIKRFNAIVITPKKPSTIYAYIKKLKDLGVVIDVGRRFVKGKKIPEQLHCLAGRWITTELQRDVKVESSLLYNTIKASAKILQYRHSEIKTIDEQKFSLLVKKLFDFAYDLNVKYSHPDNQDIRKIITSQSYWGFFYHFLTVNAILTYKELPTLRDELISCLTFHEN